MMRVVEPYKQIKFEHQQAIDIRTGRKTASFRFFDDKNIRVGDELEIVDKVERDNPASWQRIGTIHVTEVLEKLVRDIYQGDWAGSETYPDQETFLQTMSDQYNRIIEPITPLKIIRFSFEPYEKPIEFLNERQDKDTLPEEVKLYADGGSRGNPGPSAGGFVILDMNDMVLRGSSKFLGITTNNQAEYHALKGGLELCLKSHAKIVHVYMDSLLVVNQMKGIFKVSNRELWPIHDAIKKLAEQFKIVNFTHVPRELNRLADAEVNKALDALKNEGK